MLLQDGSDVPLWMTPQERGSNKFSQYDDKSLKDNKKDELIGNIKSTGIYISVVKGKRVGDLQDISRDNYISVTNIISKERMKLLM